MKLHLGKDADSLYLKLEESAVTELEVRPGIVLDINVQDQVVGIEILNVGKHVGTESLKRMCRLPSPASSLSPRRGGEYSA